MPRPLETLAHETSVVHELVYEVNEHFDGYNAAFKAGKRLVKRYFPNLGTFTLAHDEDKGWYVTLYRDEQRARQLGLIG